MSPQQDEESEQVRVRRYSDFVLAILAATATVGFAWTGFESAAWLRQRFAEADRVAELTEEALVLSARGRQHSRPLCPLGHPTIADLPDPEHPRPSRTASVQRFRGNPLPRLI